MCTIPPLLFLRSNLLSRFILLITIYECVSTAANNACWKHTETGGLTDMGHGCRSPKLQRYPTFLFCLAWVVSVNRLKFCMAPLYSCSSIKLSRAPMLPFPPNFPCKADTQCEVWVNMAQVNRNIWKTQLYARNSSIRTTFFFYLLDGH